MHENNIRLLRIKDVVSKVGLSKPTIYLKIREGDFPRQVFLGPKTVAWVESEINEWLSAKMAERTN
ncbi:AlpA family transcriptional regulator [Aeromonas veronii]|uniref:AlpA family transcriptional regulator n=1 Tax=Aeromonas veronii TaxID=654 RepID=A0A3A9INB4_AERVE|nr:AlpA family transcriptional regulator [Aeromonas veronii]RKJ89771.1 AlpA family transcriptional regulator [Aeromonas veronii]